MSLGVFPKIMFLASLQYGLGLVANLLVRHAMKTGFEGEVPASSWYSLSFLASLPPVTIICVGLVFLINVSSFPVSAWIGSFSLGLSWPVVTIVNVIAEILLVPLNLYVFKTVFNELVFSSQAIAGLLVLEAGKAVSIVGLYLIYIAGRAA